MWSVAANAEWAFLISPGAFPMLSDLFEHSKDSGTLGPAAIAFTTLALSFPLVEWNSVCLSNS